MPFSLSLKKAFNDFYPTYDTHQSYSYHMVIIALYLKDVLSGELRIPNAKQVNFKENVTLISYSVWF